MKIERNKEITNRKVDRAYVLYIVLGLILLVATCLYIVLMFALWKQ